MTTYIIPTDAVPAQSLAVSLAGQNCVVSLRQLGDRQYFSLSVDGTVICENVLIVCASRIVRAAYTGFVGDFAAVDMSGANEAPRFDGWGTRWLLLFNSDA